MTHNNDKFPKADLPKNAFRAFLDCLYYVKLFETIVWLKAKYVITHSEYNELLKWESSIYIPAKDKKIKTDLSCVAIKQGKWQ